MPSRPIAHARRNRAAPFGPSTWPENRITSLPLNSVSNRLRRSWSGFLRRSLPTHRAYGVPKPVLPDFMRALDTVRVNPYGELPEPLPTLQAAETLAKRDGYVDNETDRADSERQWPQLKGQFLIDRDGIVRWANIEGIARI